MQQRGGLADAGFTQQHQFLFAREDLSLIHI
jgi:hypothetical protein